MIGHPYLHPHPSEAVSQFRLWFESLTTSGLVLWKLNQEPFVLRFSKGERPFATQSLDGSLWEPRYKH
jgi:hypothetical protein